MSKYLKTKEGSIESAVLKSVATPKEEPKVEEKEYKTSSYFGTKEGSLGDVFNKVMNEGGPGSGPQGGEKRGTYKTGHKKSVMKPGAGKRPGSAPDGGQTDKEADDYDTEMGEKVDNPYAVGMAQAMKATGDKPPLKKSTITKAHDIAKSIKKDESINEADITLHDHDSNNKDFKDLVRKSNLTMKVKRGFKGDDVTLSGSPANIEKMLKTMYGNDWNKTYKKSGNKYIEAEYKVEDNEYQKVFKKELEKSGKSLGSMSDSEKKDFFNKIDKMYKGKNEELTPAQKKLPPALQKAIAKKMKNKKEEVKEARWEIEGVISYRGISAEDDFHMVIDAPSESAAEAKAEKELEKARDRRKIGPGGGGNIEDFDIENIQRTTDRLSAPQTTYRNSKEVEETHSYHKIKQNKKQTQADGEKEVIDPNPKLKAEDVIRGLWKKAAETISETDITKDNIKKGDSEKEKELKIKLDKEKDQDTLEKQLIAAQGQINILKQKLENEKNKAIKPEPNPETGEVPLTVGVAYKHLRAKMKKEEKRPDVVSDDEKKETKVKGKADTGSPKTPVDTEPEVDYKN